MENTLPQDGNEAVFPHTDSFDQAPYEGSFQQILAMNIGRLVRVDSLVGTNNIVNHTGYIYEVGKQYVALRQLPAETYVLIDIYSVKFVTFLNPSNYT